MQVVGVGLPVPVAIVSLHMKHLGLEFGEGGGCVGMSGSGRGRRTMNLHRGG